MKNQPKTKSKIKKFKDALYNPLIKLGERQLRISPLPILCCDVILEPDNTGGTSTYNIVIKTPEHAYKINQINLMKKFNPAF